MNLYSEGEKISEIANFDESFAEGEPGELRVYMNNPISQEMITDIENKLTQSGVVLTEPIIQDANIMSIKFQKAIAPLIIIYGALAGITGIVGWQLYKFITSVPWWVWAAGAAGTIYLLTRRHK